MMDFYIRHLIIHQFSPSHPDIQLSHHELLVTPNLDAYFQKKLAKVFSDDAKRGRFDAEHPQLSHLNDDLMAWSKVMANDWREAFVLSDNQKTNDLVFIDFDLEGQPYRAFLRLALREQLAHVDDTSDRPIRLVPNNLPSGAQAPDEALVIAKKTGDYYLIEKRIKHDGSFSNYFSEKVLQVTPKESVKKSIKQVEQTARKVAEQFHKDDFNFQTKVKSTLYQHLEEDNELSPEKLADQLFDDNLTARLTFVDRVKESLPEPVPIADIDYSRQVKKLENQKLSLSNGIELIVPNAIYQDAESVEFIQNDNGTYSILIKNIEDIKSK
ncbi:nucleoid-associated protein [Streptococcus sp. zg-JUN1979]|uniref:nucleoid-associated protein n=1 Tax=Streptococcus sp. zg-JUN1979 TaxID=3391450 RepID=UPI0039A6BDA4